MRCAFALTAIHPIAPSARDNAETKIRLTDPFIKALKAPESGTIVYPDDGLAGFGVRASEGGTKSYVLTHGKLRRRETIGRVGTIKLAKAREKAKIRLAEYTLGKSEGASMGWTEAVEAFLNDVKRRLKPRTFDGYTYELTKRFRFGDLKLDEIKAADIQQRLDRTAHSPVQQHLAFVTLGTFMKWSYRRRYVETNPMDRMVSRQWFRRPAKLPVRNVGARFPSCRRFAVQTCTSERFPLLAA